MIIEKKIEKYDATSIPLKKSKHKMNENNKQSQYVHIQWYILKKENQYLFFKWKFSEKHDWNVM